MTRWLVAVVVLAGAGWFLLPDSRRAARRDRPGIAPEAAERSERWPVGLDDPDPDRRRDAAVSLRERGEGAVPIFLDLLRNGDVGQRILAARSLGRLGHGADELLASLDPRDTPLSLEILAALGRIGTPKEDRWVLPLLGAPELRLAALQILEARSPEVVRAVADLIDPARGGEEDTAALQALGFAPGGVPQIVAAVENPSLRIEAIYALERMGPAAYPAISVLIEVIREEELRDAERVDVVPGYTPPSPAVHAADALVAIGERAIPEVLAMLDDELGFVRIHAEGILGDIGEAALPALIGAAGDASPRVREAAATALGDFGRDHPELLPTVVALSSDPDPDVRWAAVMSLNDYGPAAVPALIARLRETDDDVLDSALFSLKLLEPRDPALVPHLVRLLAHEEHEVQWGAADVLGAMWEEAGAGIPALVVALETADHFLRMSIAKALVAIGPKSIPALLARVDRLPGAGQAVAIEVFVKLEATGPGVRAACERLLRSPSSATRVRAASFLARFDDNRAAVLATLRSGLEHQQSGVRRIAVDGLERMGPAALPAVPDLLRLARAEGEREDTNRNYVDDALAAIGRAAIPQLVDALGSDSSSVAFDARRALEQIGKPAIPRIVACPPAVRPVAIPLLQKRARDTPAARKALEEWAADERVDVRLAALKALWRGTRDAKAVVPGLLKLAPTNESARYQISAIGAHAAFALDEIRAVHAKTQDKYLAQAIQKILNR